MFQRALDNNFGGVRLRTRSGRLFQADGPTMAKARGGRTYWVVDVVCVVDFAQLNRNVSDWSLELRLSRRRGTEVHGHNPCTMTIGLNVTQAWSQAIIRVSYNYISEIIACSYIGVYGVNALRLDIMTFSVFHLFIYFYLLLSSCNMSSWFHAQFNEMWRYCA